MAQGRFFKEQIATLDKVGVGTIEPSESIETTGNIKLADNGIIKLGDGNDLQLLHDGSDSIIKDVGTGNLELHATNLVFRNHLDTAQYASFINGGAVSLYYNNILKLSTSASGATIHGDLTSSNLFVSNNAALKANGSGYLELGNTNSGVIQVGGDGGDSTIAPRFNNLKIQTSRDADDIIFLAGDSTTELLRLDASASTIRIPDTVYLQVGSSSDLGIAFDGTNSIISNVTNDLNIQNYSSTGDIAIQATNGSGGVVSYLLFDGSQQQMKANKNLVFYDNKRLRLGTSADADLYSTDANVFYDHNNYDALFRHLTADKDFVFSTTPTGGSLTELLRLDGSASKSIFSANVQAQDNVRIYAGSSGDLAIFHDGSNSTISNNTGNLTFQTNPSGSDMIFRAYNVGSTGTAAYFALDGGIGKNVFSRGLRIPDGTGGDPAISFTGGSDTGFYRSDYTSSPQKDQVNLSIDGNTKFKANEAGIWSVSGNIYLANGHQFRTFQEWLATTGGAGYGFKFRNTADGIDSAVISNTGELTLKGNTSPSKIEVYETFTDTSNYERSFFKHASSFLEIGTEALGTGTASGLKLKTAGADRVTVLTDGNVGIGTDSPSARLHVNGPAAGYCRSFKVTKSRW